MEEKTEELSYNEFSISVRKVSSSFPFPDTLTKHTRFIPLYSEHQSHFQSFSKSCDQKTDDW